VHKHTHYTVQSSAFSVTELHIDVLSVKNAMINASVNFSTYNKVPGS